jgi:hypothetical protein
MERDAEVEVTQTRGTAVTRRAAGTTDIARSDLISWSSIIAGMLVAFGLFVLFGAIGAAAGLEADDARLGAQVGSIITGLFGVLSFVVGGFVAAWTADVDEADTAIMHGFLVWALFVVFAAGVVALGAGTALGSLAGGLGAPNVDLTREEASDAGWATVFALTIAVASSILGALLATREEILGRFARRGQ